jgi:hypothetical protein
MPLRERLVTTSVTATLAFVLVFSVSLGDSQGSSVVIQHVYKLNPNGGFSSPGTPATEQVGSSTIKVQPTTWQNSSSSNTTLSVATAIINGTISGYWIMFQSLGGNGTFAVTGITLLEDQGGHYVGVSIFSWSPKVNASVPYNDGDGIYTLFGSTLGSMFSATSRGFSNLSATYAGSSNGSRVTWGIEEGAIAYGIGAAGALLPSGVSTLSMTVSISVAHSVDVDTYGGWITTPRVIGAPGCNGNYGCAPDGWCFNTFSDYWFQCAAGSVSCSNLQLELLADLIDEYVELISCAVDGGITCIIAAAEALIIVDEVNEWYSQHCAGTPCSYYGAQNCVT